MTDTERKAEGVKRFRGFMAEMGATLTVWELDRAVIEMDVGDVHLNAIDVVHGGVIAALIDTAGAHSGIFCTVPGNIRQAMTVSLNVNLMGNVASGRLMADARKRGGGKTIFVASCDVTDEAGNLLATGEVTCRYGRGSHLPEGITPPRSEA
jgi:uncharacterized protein (TIGR00369 family)